MVQGTQKHQHEEHDPVLEKIAKFQEFVQKNKTNILIGIMAVIIIAVLGGSWYKKNQDKDHKMSTSVGIAANAFVKKDYAAVIDQLSEKVEEFAGTDASKLGKFYLAASKFHSDEIEEAMHIYLEVASEIDNSMIESACYAGAAACKESIGDIESAQEDYITAANKCKMKYLKHEFLFRSANLLAQLEKFDDALQILNEILDDDPEAMQKNSVDFLIASLLK